MLNPNRSIYHAIFNTDAGEGMIVRAILNFYQQSSVNRHCRRLKIVTQLELRSDTAYC